MTDQTATPARDTRRRPWWAGRVEVRELLELEAGNPAARPTWPRPPSVTGVLGGAAQRRRQELPTPPRRERPLDLEATAAGVALYGPRRAVPAPFQHAAPVSRTPADTLGTKLSYTPLEGRAARIRLIRFAAIGGAWGALRVEIQLIRGGAIFPLWIQAADFVLAPGPITLLPGDELRLEATVAGAAGVELVSMFSVEEWT